MRIIKAFVKNHPLLSFFALVFAISWGGVLLVVGPSGFPAAREEVETPFAILAMAAGPPVAGLLLTGLLYGRAGFRHLLTRMTRWRVGARWYAVALLTAPLSMTAVLLALSLISPVFLPGILTTSDKASVLLFGIAVGLAAGIFEELGWTGFAIPTMRLRYGVLSTGLIVGMLWGAWHLLVNVWASGSTSGELPLAIYLPAVLLFTLPGQLTAFRVLMVWVYERTGGSLLVAGILMHVSVTASTLVLAPLAISGVSFLILGLAYAAATWVLVGALALANHGHLTRELPLRRRVA